MAKAEPNDAQGHKLTRVEPGSRPFSIQVAWSDGVRAEVDFSPLLERAYFAPLKDAALFSQAEITDWGWTIAWPNNIEWGADNLRMLADQQAFEAWMVRHKFTYDAAADMLGLSRRAVAYYKSGERPIPRLVKLACRGVDADLGQSSAA